MPMRLRTRAIRELKISLHTHETLARWLSALYLNSEIVFSQIGSEPLRYKGFFELLKFRVKNNYGFMPILAVSEWRSSHRF